ncbi:MAG: NAD-dependent epimerase/dehydratase family protein [Bacteroidota bacterium]|nr:NAD-dependent epimerase/dehydratase family protein [Bacteroidota bacterium]
MHKKVIITGAGGFIGAYLVNYFHVRSYEVLALCHQIPVDIIPGVRYRKYNLGSYIYQKDFENADYVIHCAFVKYSKKQKDANELNIQGTKDLYFTSWKHNVKKFVFLSSLSAHEKASSNYGKSKFETEKIINKDRDAILCPGLVIGDGGLYKSIEKILSTKKNIPLIDGGKQLLYTILIEELAEIIEKVCLENISGKYIVADKKPIMMKDLYNSIAAHLENKPRFINVPFFLAYIGLSIVEMLNLSLPITRENLLGLKQLKAYDDENLYIRL